MTLPARELVAERILWVTVWGLGKEVVPPYALCYEYDGDNRCRAVLAAAAARMAAVESQVWYGVAATRKVSAIPW